MRSLSLLYVVLFIITLACATDRFVDGTAGSDSNDGLVVGKAYKTVNKCASVAVAGDTCFIRAGVYRETVNTLNSGSAGKPITYTNYNGESVVISGLNVVSSKTAVGWSVHSGNIWKTNLMNWDVTDHSWSTSVMNANIMDNQIFVDGAMMVNARWPNLSPSKVTSLTFNDFASMDNATNDDGTNAVIVDYDLRVFPTDFWKGTLVNIAIGDMFQHATCNVGSSTSSTFQLSCTTIDGTIPGAAWISRPWMKKPRATNCYYLWNTLKALDAPGEWFFDRPTKTLYMYFPDSASPASHVVEAKARLDAFIVAKDYITLKGIAIKGGRLRTDVANNLVLSNMDIGFTWSQLIVPPGAVWNFLPGMAFRGNYNTLTDSYIHDSATHALYVAGSGHLLSNNVFARNNYAPVGQAVIVGSQTNVPSKPHLFTMNTVFQTADIGVILLPALELSYNDIYHTGQQRTDFGPIYAIGNPETLARGATIHHNWLHSCYSKNDNGYGGCSALYLDCGAKGFSLYRNVVWDVSACGILGMGQRSDTTWNEDNIYAYNTIAWMPPRPPPQNGKQNFYPQGVCFFANQLMKNITVVNNIAETKTNINAGVTLTNNYIGPNLGITDPANLNFDLLPSSPGRATGKRLNNGMDYPGLSNGVVPDMGAYQSGLADWAVPGAVIRAGDMASIKVTCAAPTTSLSCTISGIAFGRKLAPSFAVGLGPAPSTFGLCKCVFNYDTNTATASCNSIPLISGQTRVYIKQNSASAWIATSTYINTAVTPAPTPKPSVAPTASPPTQPPTQTPTQAPTPKPSAPTVAPPSADFWVLTASDMKMVSVGGPQVYGINSNDVAAWWDGTKFRPTGTYGLTYTDVDDACDYTALALDTTGKLWRSIGGTSWVNVPTSSVTLKKAAAASQTNIWGLTTAGTIVRYSSISQTWSTQTFGASGVYIDIDVGCDGSVWVVDDGNVGHRWNGTSTPQVFQTIPGQLAQIAAGGWADAFALDPWGNSVIWRTNTWVSMRAKFTSIGCGQDSSEVWAVAADGNTYRWNGVSP